MHMRACLIRLCAVFLIAAYIYLLPWPCLYLQADNYAIAGAGCRFFDPGFASCQVIGRGQDVWHPYCSLHLVVPFVWLCFVFKQSSIGATVWNLEGLHGWCT
jgi:hypothetical protein